MSAWARDNGFSALDLGVVEGEAAKAVQGGKLRLGSVDLPEWQPMLSLDPSKRREAVARNVAYVGACVEACGAAGPLNFFVVMLSEDPHAPPREVFDAMVANYRDLAPVLEAHGARLEQGVLGLAAQGNVAKAEGAGSVAYITPKPRAPQLFCRFPNALHFFC